MSPGAGAVSQLAGRPRTTADEARRILARHWGHEHATVVPLVSERDQNWRVDVDGAPVLVLKIANSGDGRDVIDLQYRIMQILGDAGVPCPTPQPTVDGRPTIEVAGNQVWAIDFRPGTPLAEVSRPGPELWHDLGAVLASADVALTGFDHPLAHRILQWDTNNAAQVLRRYAPEIVDPQRRSLVLQVLQRFESLAPALAALPTGVIHNDANDHNILVADGRVAALLDFGDAVHTTVVNELAIACAYAMLDRDDPASVRDALCAGYLSRRELSEPELAVLDDLIRTRLAVSVSISAHQRALEPDDAYLGISEEPAWRLLARLQTGEGSG